MIKVGVKNKANDEDEEEPLSMTMLEKKFFLSSMLGAITLYVAYEYILEKKSDREDQVCSTNEILKILNEDPINRGHQE